VGEGDRRRQSSRVSQQSYLLVREGGQQVKYSTGTENGATYTFVVFGRGWVLFF
jgi:hypothetical protein